MRCLFRYATQHQSALSNHSLIFAIVNDRSFIVGIFLGTDGFPSFT
jgi:hypothetical protein